jgi:hypothetical protein
MKLYQLFALVFSLLLLGGIAVSNSGCLALAAGAGAGVAYSRGDLESSMDQPVDKLAKASVSALETLKFSNVTRKEDALSATIEAKTSGDKKIEITIKSITPRISKISIRVGVFGDKAISRAILEKIQAGL